MRLSLHLRRASRRRAEAATPLRPRPQFAFGVALEQVPAATVGTLARVTTVLLDHGDHHVGLPARMRVALDDEGLSLWVSDPECSTTCLDQSGDLDAICDPRDPALAGVHVTAKDQIGGLRLHWSIELAPAAPGAGSGNAA